MLNETLQWKIAKRKKFSLHRKRQVTKLLDQNKVNIYGQVCISFASNDYLGLKKHPKIIAALTEACKKYGFGSGSSAFISGYSDAHQAIEQQFAQWLDVDSAILFSSGYCANIGIVPALSQRTDTIFSDRLCHASILDGIVLSRAKHKRYQHNNPKHLAALAEKYSPKLIVTESVFSMEGDIAPISDLSKLAKQYKSGLIIDDAHGIGILGKSGKGISEQFALDQKDYSCLVLPLGKAFNAMGAIVAGRKDIVDAILQFARSYCYNTALPPAVCAALQTTLTVIEKETWKRQRLQDNISLFIGYASYKGLIIVSKAQTPIKSIVVQSIEKILLLQKWLLSKGFYVSAIRPPTVPKNNARLRISINSMHTKEQIIQLVDYIVEGLKTC